MPEEGDPLAGLELDNMMKALFGAANPGEPNQDGMPDMGSNPFA